MEQLKDDVFASAEDLLRRITSSVRSEIGLKETFHVLNYLSTSYSDENKVVNGPMLDNTLGFKSGTGSKILKRLEEAKVITRTGKVGGRSQKYIRTDDTFLVTFLLAILIAYRKESSFARERINFDAGDQLRILIVLTQTLMELNIDIGGREFYIGQLFSLIDKFCDGVKLSKEVEDIAISKEALILKDKLRDYIAKIDDTMDIFKDSPEIEHNIGKYWSRFHLAHQELLKEEAPKAVTEWDVIKQKERYNRELKSFFNRWQLEETDIISLKKPIQWSIWTLSEDKLFCTWDTRTIVTMPSLPQFVVDSQSLEISYKEFRSLCFPSILRFLEDLRIKMEDKEFMLMSEIILSPEVFTSLMKQTNVYQLLSMNWLKADEWKEASFPEHSIEKMMEGNITLRDVNE